MQIARPRSPIGYLAPLFIGSILACGEELTAPVVSENTPNLETATAAASLAFYQVSGGGAHTCGVTTANRAYCWGLNFWGQLGDGTTTEHHTPVAVAGGLRFRQISTRRAGSCGITIDYRAYCWGGEFGDGTPGDLTPTPVAGGRQFRWVDTGNGHTCGVSYPDGRGYCWGTNSDGQVGDGTTNPRPAPVAVAGGLRFGHISVGEDHTCGVTTDARAFCWGSNRYGQIGDRTEVSMRLTPTPVADGHRFRQLDAGVYYTCGVTTANRAYCWGNGRSGQLGNGKAYLSFWPRQVSGGLQFDRVTAGHAHTCGETTLNRLYCWGYNYSGQLGDGTTTTFRLTPVPVAGGLYFSQASAGAWHTCGKTAAGKGYCWGNNINGELGDGTTTNRSRPVAVAGGT
jgi:alpha-tubulin suppressor-like RCC1 family protein